MTGPQAALIAGDRLHLQYGPIDLIIGVDGDRATAFAAARAAFEGLLEGLVAELPLLRGAGNREAAQSTTATGRRMIRATAPFAAETFVTPMAAVAGSVADTILAAMCTATQPRRAYVNNGGDIALYLGARQTFALGMAAHDGSSLGQVTVSAEQPTRGVATSARHGRSLSLGIADSVTVLADTAAAADVAATLIANAVDLPGHPAITRRPAEDLQPESDLGQRLVVTACEPLTANDRAAALASGIKRAETFARRGLIHAAALFLQGDSRVLSPQHFSLSNTSLAHA